ncbi:MAG: hypothetical protein MjAS7_0169 [Metallosphaera javensis (ex Sakai et al. 2022)]|nr:MAG: hypothetical protein MjAS7_0169 [Metallosphaera javensis (ex Sakai et al. 2022)]
MEGSVEKRYLLPETLIVLQYHYFHGDSQVRDVVLSLGEESNGHGPVTLERASGLRKIQRETV